MPSVRILAALFNADGTYVSPAGAFQVRVSVLNNSQLLIGNPDGTIGISQRC